MSKHDSLNQKVSLLHVLDASSYIDRTRVYAILPDVPYGTISGRIVDLVKAGLLKEAGTVTYHVPHLRLGFNLGGNWNPVAASDAPLHQGDQTTKRYMKTDKWSWLAAYKVIA